MFALRNTTSSHEVYKVHMYFKKHNYSDTIKERRNIVVESERLFTWMFFFLFLCFTIMVKNFPFHLLPTTSISAPWNRKLMQSKFLSEMVCLPGYKFISILTLSLPLYSCSKTVDFRAFFKDNNIIILKHI